MASTIAPLGTERTVLSRAQILEGKITLDRAIKHIQNRTSTPLPSPNCPELEAVMLMETRWAQLEMERVRKVNSSRRRRLN